jgi:hypothetical protein
MRKTVLISVYSFVVLLSMTSCGGGNGPKGQIEIADRSDDELVKDIIEAQENDHYYYKGRVELHYEEDGEWVSAGMYKQYNYPNGTGEINDFISFDGDMFPVRYADKGGYTFCVQYHGVMYYY